MADNPLVLKPGTRLRTGGATYEVTDEASVPAGVVPVVPQPARLLKVFCETCGYTARITQRWITKSGTPECPACLRRMTVEVKGEKAEKADKPSPVVPVYTVYTSAPVVTVPKVESDLAELLDDEPEEPSVPEADGPSPLAQLLAEL